MAFASTGSRFSAICFRTPLIHGGPDAHRRRFGILDTRSGEARCAGYWLRGDIFATGAWLIMMIMIPMAGGRSLRPRIGSDGTHRNKTVVVDFRNDPGTNRYAE